MPVTDEPTIAQLCAAYTHRMAPNQHFSHATAAMLYGLPIPLKMQSTATLHVTTVTSGVPPRVKGIVGHQVEAELARMTVLGGLRLASPTEVWCQLAAVLSLDDLIAVGDALVRRQHPLASMDDLMDAVRRWVGRRGVKRLRSAVSMVRVGVDSPKETAIRLILVRGKLPEPEVNGTILSKSGAFLALGDLVYRAHKVLVEYDGGHHFDSVAQAHHDIDRLDRVMADGWRVIRLNKTHLGRPDVVAGKVRNALRERGWSG